MSLNVFGNEGGKYSKREASCDSEIVPVMRESLIVTPKLFSSSNSREI